MPVISNVEELLGHLGAAISSPDPLAALKEQGVTLTPTLQQKLNEATAAKRLTAEERRRHAKEAAKLGTVRFNVRPLQLLTRGLPVNEFDFIASLRLSILNETLAALFAGIDWPKELPGGEIFFNLGQLRRLSDDVPTSDNIRVGTVHLSGPAEIAPIDGTSHVLIRLPFSVDILSTIPLPLPASAGRSESEAYFSGRGVAIRCGLGADG